MKIRWLGVAALLVVWIATGEGAPAKGSSITVTAMSAKVMKKPSFLGAAAAPVVRGDHLVFQSAKGDWYQVGLPGGAQGWIHKSNVVDKQVALNTKPGGDSGGASADEVALAGRGFSPQVEGQYRKDHPNLDFSHVDAIEKLAVDPAVLEKFAASGKLAGAGQ